MSCVISAGDEDAETIASDVDCNGILWEYFNARTQAGEIEELWPGSGYQP